MKQTIRALGIAIYVLWLIVIVFTATIMYSAFQLAEGVAFGTAQTSTSGGTMTLSLPFSVDNKGFYDISDLNITTILQESNGALVSNSTTVVPLILHSNRVDATHNISITLDKMTSASLSRLLFNDTDFNVTLSLALKYAGVIPLKISMNFTTTWGAPLHNLTIGGINYNSTRSIAAVSLSFENHSFFSLNGTMRIEIINTLDLQVGATTTPINVPPQTPYLNPIEVPVSAGYGSFKEVRLYFDFPSVFSYGPKVIEVTPIG